MTLHRISAADVFQVKNWAAGTNETNGELVLQLVVHPDPTMTFQLSHWQVQEMVEQLTLLARQTMPGKPN